MSTFACSVIPYIEEYKNILRKLFLMKEANAKIYRLKITNKQLANILHIDDLKTFEICEEIINDATELLKLFPSKKEKLNFYIKNFKECISRVKKVEGKIINPKQEIARQIIEIIQSKKNNKIIDDKIMICIKFAQKYGTTDDMIETVEILNNIGNAHYEK